MDSERTIFKAMFLDFPIQEVIDHLISGNFSNDGPWYSDAIKQKIHENEPARNMQEVEALYGLYEGQWMNQIQHAPKTVPMAGSFKLLYHCADLFFKTIKDGLVIDHNHILGWNTITRLAGEDLLVCAKKVRTADEKPKTFAWPDVMNCGGEVVERIGDEKLCDIHAHLGGAANPFILNWLCLMTGSYMQDNLFHVKGEEYGPMRKWSVLAARIRVEMYRKFILGQGDTFGKDFKTCLKKTLGTLREFYEARNQTNTILEQSKKGSLYTHDGHYVDYAIREDFDDENINSPYMLWHGERRLLYCFLKVYLTGTKEIRTIARYVYLYCLIKNQFRSELIITKKHMGLSNFKEYNNKKHTFIRADLNRLINKYAFQTSMRRNTEDSVELRINAAPMEISSAKDWSLNQCIFTKGQWFGDDQTKNVSYVIHLSKSRYPNGSVEADDRTKIQNLLEEDLRKGKVFTGIDAAGEEMICRPEMLGHHYRYLRARGHRNFTYHVGEDFIDIADGLRAIDEAIVFLNVTKGWRLGHCVAMGIDVKKFYERKNHQICLSSQTLLDNLVWILKRSEALYISIPQRLRSEMTDRVRKLYKEIGYETDFSLDSYYHSIWLRSDVQGGIELNNKRKVSWEDAMKCHHQRCEEARKDSKATIIAHEYRVKEAIRVNGNKTETYDITKEYETVIMKLQKETMKTVKQLNVGIECCPTSNMMLCNLDRYDEAPLLRFRYLWPLLGNHLSVSINTDDKGLFATSLLNEFALMASAISKREGWLWKREWSEKLITMYLRGISRRGYDLKFNWENNKYETCKY